MNCNNVKRAILAVVGLIGLCVSVSAQQPFDSVSTFMLYRPEIFAELDSSSLVADLPMRTFLDGRLPGSTPLGRMGTASIANFPVALISAEPRRHNGNSDRKS